MAVYAPANSCTVASETGCGLGDFCPKLIDGCRNGCFDIVGCEINRIDIPLGCNPFTGEDLESGDITDIIFTGTYENDGTVEVFELSLINDAGLFTIIDLFTYRITLQPEDTADWPSGVLDAEIVFVTTDGTYTPYKFPLCVDRLTLADPEVEVTGESGIPSTFTIVNNTVQLWFHDSDTVHATKTWDRFVVEWGDTMTDTLDVSGLQPPVAATWNLTHVYAATGTYEVSVTGYLDSDDQDPCDPELSHCLTFNVCINTVV